MQKLHQTTYKTECEREREPSQSRSLIPILHCTYFINKPEQQQNGTTIVDLFIYKKPMVFPLEELYSMSSGGQQQRPQLQKK